MKLKIITFILLNFFFFQNTIANVIAYFDLNYIINNSNSGKIIIDKLENINIENINSLKKDQLIINKQREEINRTKNILSNDELDKKINDLNNKLEKFNKKQADMSVEFKKLRQNEIKNFVKKINPIIEKYMINNNIELILNKESVFISKIDYDITNKLILFINENIDK